MPPAALFLERVPTVQFREPSSVWGYLPQLNEWGSIYLVWDTERVGGADHIPQFRAVPVYRGERLEVFAGMGLSKKAAKEEAAKQMALSGHCGI
ncbi:hypothetical protein GSI_06094 [Ganoderma sinense ZZ0214-1]|uniref:DRBM domain-containing protein n=1 Tax=Ganoderma sinense ZZ0214-1 TaxID=1077348 RepID=A0A2G8SCB9_9APHY|nr:hypothetical protein GSI_06094 [Ganoderma sinense ZZ0214-1]